MDFAALPPEVNSARIYAGPGAGPMLCAATAWDALATELYSAATDYSSAVTGLSAGPWRGPAAQAMAATVTIHIAWLTATAGLAELTAGQARSAARAFGTVFAMTVPPQVVAANRSLWASLVAGNVFGQTSPAIATADAQYAEMWAQDVTAMYEYAAASARASTLTPFASSPATKGADTSARQTIAISATGTGSPTTGLASVLQNIGLSSPLNYLSPANTAMGATGLVNAYAASESSSQARNEIMRVGYEISGTEDQILGRMDQVGVPRLGSDTTGGPATVSAVKGMAGAVGGLSVPPAWTAAPALHARMIPLSAAPLGPAEDALAVGRESLLDRLAVLATTTAGGRVAGSRSKPSDVAAGARHEMRPHGGRSGSFATLAADLYELARLHELGILTDEEFARQKRRLLGE